MHPRVRALLRRFPEPLRYRWHVLYHHREMIREKGWRRYFDWHALKSNLWARALLQWPKYSPLTEADLRSRKRSSTVFLFGSGHSLNELQPEDWAHFAEHDIVGFSGFIYQKWIRTDFHMIRGWAEGSTSQWVVAAAKEYVESLKANEHFSNSVILVQAGFTAQFGNAVIASAQLDRSMPVFPFHSAKTLSILPSERLQDGLVHGCATLMDALNFAYVMGWKTIVLVGVDLYDRRYFWGPADATLVMTPAGVMEPVQETWWGSWNDIHYTVQNGIVDLVRVWAEHLRKSGVSVYVQNPRSLLAAVLPVYGRESGDRSAE